MSEYFEIENNIETLSIIKRSRFITRLFKVYSVKEADEALKNIKDIEKRATHNCSAYRVLNGTTVFESRSDDGEPGGTAGSPMLSVLSGESIINVLAVVTRYYGGTKLGTGGLVKAYSDSVKNALEQSKLKKYLVLNEMNIKFQINSTTKVNHFLESQKIEIAERDFSGSVKYKLRLTDEQSAELHKTLIESGLAEEITCL